MSSDLCASCASYYYWCVVSISTFFLNLVKIELFFMVSYSSLKSFPGFPDLFQVLPSPLKDPEVRIQSLCLGDARGVCICPSLAVLTSLVG